MPHPFTEAFRAGMRELGYADGHDCRARGEAPYRDHVQLSRGHTSRRLGGKPDHAQRATAPAEQLMKRSVAEKGAHIGHE
jgi:hypothetical protein